MIGRLLLILTLLVCLPIPAATAEPDPTSEPAADLGEEVAEVSRTWAKAKANAAQIENYEALVILTERHGGRIKGSEYIRCVYNRDPFALYYQWTEPGLYEGLQASHDPVRDGADHFMALETGVRSLIGLRRWHVDSRIIKALYPHHFSLTKYHIGFLLEHVDWIHRNAIAKGKIKVRIDRPEGEDLSKSPIPGHRLTFFTIDLSEDPDDGLLYSRCVLGVDEQTSLPLFIETYDFEDRLQLSYKILSLTPNTNLDVSVFTLKKR